MVVAEVVVVQEEGLVEHDHVKLEGVVDQHQVQPVRRVHRHKDHRPKYAVDRGSWPCSVLQPMTEVQSLEKSLSRD